MSVIDESASYCGKYVDVSVIDESASCCGKYRTKQVAIVSYICVHDVLAEKHNLQLFSSDNKINILEEFNTETCKAAKHELCNVNSLESNKLLNCGPHNLAIMEW